MRPAGREDVDVERPELVEQGAEAFDVLIDPIGLHALQDDDEVGQGPRLDLLGDAQVDPGGWVMPPITSTSTYSRIDGSMPLCTMWGTASATSPACRTAPAPWPRRSDRGCTFTVTSVVTASVPSEPTSSWVRS